MVIFAGVLGLFGVICFLFLMDAEKAESALWYGLGYIVSILVMNFIWRSF
jgi:hypothetical protein